jgi:hypothetical protein
MDKITINSGSPFGSPLGPNDHLKDRSMPLAC